MSPGARCLRCHPACFDLGPRRRAVCLETRSRARELGQASVGISGRWWDPWLHRELLLGRKGWVGAGSSIGALVPLPTS